MISHVEILIATHNLNPPHTNSVQQLRALLAAVSKRETLAPVCIKLGEHWTTYMLLIFYNLGVETKGSTDTLMIGHFQCDHTLL